MKQLTGIVTSNKMQNTVTVIVERHRLHPVYKKTIKRRKKFLAHTKEKLKLGSKVIIQETKPISKRKKWQVVKILN